MPFQGFIFGVETQDGLTTEVFIKSTTDKQIAVPQAQALVSSLPGETDRYEMHKHHHHHFHCNSCHQVTDIDACPGDLASLMPSGYLLEAHELTLYGRCPDCASAGVRPQDKAGRST
ncbi:MAG: hypothetical protein EB065_11510 [Betaproteobacteria bacterium]|nr:hypothetical protein [Betaproteobacteria bacterium]